MPRDRIYETNPQLAAFAAEQRAIYVADAQPIEFSDEELALRFSNRHADTARFVAAWGKWLLWQGACWQIDRTLQVFDFARALCRAASAELSSDKAKLAADIASAKKVAAVVTLARADRRHASTIEQWDPDPWLVLTNDEGHHRGSNRD